MFPTMFLRAGFSRSRVETGIVALGAAVVMIAGCGSGGAAAGSSSGSSPTSSQSSASPSSSAQSSAPSSSGSDAGSSQSTETSAQSSSSAASSAPSTRSYPVTVTATNGSVTLDAQPTAIVSLSATATEMLYAVGAGSQVIGVDNYSDYPTQGLPATKFDAYQLNIEAVAKVKPDLVVASNLSDDQLKRFAALKIPVLLDTAATKIDDTYRQIDQLGAATGHPGEATALVEQMKEHIAKIVAEAPKFTPPATYYYELEQTYYSVTSDTFIGSLLGMLGLHSIADSAEGAASSGGYPQLSAEFIVKSNPDYIFLSDTKCCQQSPATVAARPGWSTLSAVKGDRVVPLDDDIASRWGPRVVDLLQDVVTAMEEHPAQR